MIYRSGMLTKRRGLQFIKHEKSTNDFSKDKKKSDKIDVENNENKQFA